MHPDILLTGTAEATANTSADKRRLVATAAGRFAVPYSEATHTGRNALSAGKASHTPRDDFYYDPRLHIQHREQRSITD